MALVKPFYCIRPEAALACRVAALPYDVYSREEAKRETEREPLSFLCIDRAETQLSDDVDAYDGCVYEKARVILETMIREGTYVTEEEPCFYVYELTMGTHSQTGIVACCSADDYMNDLIKKHENTREDKELDRVRHVDVTNAQTGPIFLAYRADSALKRLCAQVKAEAPLYDFTSSDGVRHRVFKIADRERKDIIIQAFSRIPNTYIADGHHRAASAVKVAQKRRKENPNYTGEEEFNYFLSVLFPDDELTILPYNRVVRDLNGLTEQEFLQAVMKDFDLQKAPEQTIRKEPEQEDGGMPEQTDGYAPERKGEFGLFLGNTWYRMRVKNPPVPNDPVKGLDVSILQECLLDPILGIGDPRTDARLGFIGGIRGLKELERRVSEDMSVAFSLYPTSMEELLNVADAGLLMPPKSTWFEPKLRSGLFIHRLK